MGNNKRTRVSRQHSHPRNFKHTNAFVAANNKAPHPTYFGGITTSPRDAVNTVDDTEFDALRRSASRLSLDPKDPGRPGSSLSFTGDSGNASPRGRRTVSESYDDRRANSSPSLWGESRLARTNRQPLHPEQQPSRPARRRTSSESAVPVSSNSTAWLNTIGSPSRLSRGISYAEVSSPPRFPAGSRDSLFPELKRETPKPVPVRPATFADAVRVGLRTPKP